MSKKKTAGKKERRISPDTAVRNYWNRNEEFADLFNAVLFRGECVIRPDELAADDTDSSVIREDSHGNAAESIRGSRDILKVSRRSTIFGVQLAILGLESQEKVHYAMPLRVMGYDYITYKKQYDANAREFRKKYKSKKSGSVTGVGSLTDAEPVTGAEFLSGMRRTDRFAPVVTIVIYYGEEPWDGAISLHDILDIPAEMKPYVNDYKMILVEARQNDLVFHNMNNRDLFFLFQLTLDHDLPRAEKKKRFQEYCESHQTGREVLFALGGALNMKMDYSMYEKKEDESVSCTFFEEIMEEGRAEGRAEGKAEGKAEGRAEGKAQGIIETGIEYGASAEDILNKLQRKLDISRKEAQKYFQLYGKQAM